MTKAFLSHSSKDKGFVKLVADDLGSALCHYDERTFEPSGESADEILAALQDSDVFVLFYSANALSSNWVKHEISYARHLYFEGKIKRVAIFPLDDTPRDLLDTWLKPFVVHSLPVAKLASLRIRSLLLDGESKEARFIGRDLSLNDLKDKIRGQSSSRSSGVIISGINGIGKRRLLQRAYQDLYPFVSKYWVEINLFAYEGEGALYERLVEYFEVSNTWESAKQKFEEFLALDSVQRTKKISDILMQVEKAKQVVVLNFADDAVTAEGEIEPWLLRIMRTTNTSYPTLAVVTARGPSPRALAALSDIPTAKLYGLEEKYAFQLLELLGEDQGIDVASSKVIVEQIVELVGGHPGMLELSAKLMKAIGVTRFKIDLHTAGQKSALEEYVERALGNIAFTPHEHAAILLLDELGGATREDLLFGFSSVVDEIVFSESLARLLDFGLVEEAGGELRAASHLRLVIRRWRGNPELQEMLGDVRKRLVEILDTALSLEGGSYLAIRAPIAAAIRQEGDYVNVLLSKPLMAAQQLRVARRLYDERLLTPAAEKAKRAFESRIGLSEDGIIESLRIIGLVGARQRDSGLKQFAYDELRRISEPKARKILAFIQGFEKRLAGEFKEAERLLLVAFDNGGTADFHVSRELAASLLELGRIAEAEKYARGALRIAPTNPYVLDILIGCLINKLRETPSDRGLEGEIDTLLGRLIASDGREHRSFSLQRRIAFSIARRDYAEASRMLDRYKKHADKDWYKALLGEYHLKNNDARSALSVLEKMYRPNEDDGYDEIITSFGYVRRLRILSFADAGRFDEAVQEFERNSRFLDDNNRDHIKRELVAQIATSGATHTQRVRDFARS